MCFPVDKAIETKAADTVSLCVCVERMERIRGECTGDCYGVVCFYFIEGRYQCCRGSQ